MTAESTTYPEAPRTGFNHESLFQQTLAAIMEKIRMKTWPGPPRDVMVMVKGTDENGDPIGQQQS